MKKVKSLVCILLAVAVFFGSCTSSTMIMSNPPGAKVFLNGEMVGKTPYRHSDAKLALTTTNLKLEKDGYKPFYTDFTRNEQVDVGAVVGGIFLWFPFFWAMKYNPTRTYDLEPIGTVSATETVSAPIEDAKISKLRELKKLLDEGIITQQEFEKEKAKVLSAE